MALITVSGEPGCHIEEVAIAAARRLGFELITEDRLLALAAQEFGSDEEISCKAWRPALLSILARLATRSHLVVCCRGAEYALRNFLGVLRVRIVAPEARRAGAIMLEQRVDRPTAHRILRETEALERAGLKRRFGRSSSPPHIFDLLINEESLETEQAAELIECVSRVRKLAGQGLLSAAADAELQFQARLQLSRYGIMPGRAASIKRAAFSHPSEEVFANLLDFYRIAWAYEPHSFPIQWDKDGRVLESFTPDFYLPEVDLYVELTTMKQALVTRKNRKIKLMRDIYPQVNIQVFYQKDFQNLIFKYGLADKPQQL
jgi:cytidylate kinase